MFERHQSREDRYHRRGPQEANFNERERERNARWNNHEDDHSPREFDEKFARGSRDMKESSQAPIERDRESRDWGAARGDDRQLRRDESDFSSQGSPSQRFGSEGSRPYDQNYDLAHEQSSRRDSDRGPPWRERWGHYPSGRLTAASSSDERQQRSFGRRYDDDYGSMQGNPERDFTPSSSPSQSSPSARGKGPKGYQRSDERIREEICDELTRHHSIDASHIEVETRQGEVTLKGYVERRQEKYMAEELCEGIMGVKDVHNQLRVGQDPSKGQSSERTDSSPMSQSLSQAKL